ncbi:hypothetical protein DFA_09226 [Cavenderia fasciculata]|uniref:Leucine-rich repeat-containing protein n=1 Tax=Cavenderia fasciculata TaxID=261658 RepID=F4Q716_CACFS|nr:uncharacterized protein DFA_09226 [Cavenderia fasciculata]EGG16198.1 hypothetical protein DFA_09226 [Cavenderia fasciculata]|eukprot:XP_004354582.1 hypothetical protein DFA_09226 [Cavenderia fasciculata]
MQTYPTFVDAITSFKSLTELDLSKNSIVQNVTDDELLDRLKDLPLRKLHFNEFTFFFQSTLPSGIRKLSTDHCWLVNICNRNPQVKELALLKQQGIDQDHHPFQFYHDNVQKVVINQTTTTTTTTCVLDQKNINSLVLLYQESFNCLASKRV